MNLARLTALLGLSVIGAGIITTTWTGQWQWIVSGIVVGLLIIFAGGIFYRKEEDNRGHNQHNTDGERSRGWP